MDVKYIMNAQLNDIVEPLKCIVETLNGIVERLSGIIENLPCTMEQFIRITETLNGTVQ